MTTLTASEISSFLPVLRQRILENDSSTLVGIESKKLDIKQYNMLREQYEILVYGE
jgi:hypothetical protein